eukprot:scaffold3577_cov414-Prasinococcus_capsulatus_cf.AAC.9
MGYALLVLCCLGSGYTSVLLSRLKGAVPSAVILSDLGEAAYGKKGRLVVTAVQYVYMGSVCVVFQVGSAIALQQVLRGVMRLTHHTHTHWLHDLSCFPWTSALVTLVCFPLSLIRTLHDIAGPLSILGISTIIFCLVVILVELLKDERAEGIETDLQPGKHGFASVLDGFMDIVFAYGGQELMVEMIGEMKQPSHFWRSITLAMVWCVLRPIGDGGGLQLRPTLSWEVSDITILDETLPRL